MGGQRDRVPDRIRWVVDELPLRADHRVLEVGGAPGVAAALVCASLDAGRMLVVERSAAGVRRIVERNAEHVRSGRLEVRHAALAELAPEPDGAAPAGAAPDGFDLAFAVDVNVFWTGTADRELRLLAALLRPGAPLFVAYGAEVPSGVDRPVVLAEQHLRAAGFEDVHRRSGEAGALAVGRRRGTSGVGSHFRG
jgi:hypothetical protein